LVDDTAEASAVRLRAFAADLSTVARCEPQLVKLSFFMEIFHCLKNSSWLLA
jgi:hypothetical protein